MRYLILSFLILTTACTKPITDNMDHIDMAQAARPAFMVNRTLQISDKAHHIWERMHTRYAPATLYIGGWDTEQRIPLGLSLAVRDKGQNVAWAPTIDPAALDHMRNLYDLTGFDIVVTNNIMPDLWSNLSKSTHVNSLRTVAAPFPQDKGLTQAFVNIPQVHFIGAMDEVHTPAHYHSFRQDMGASSCVKYSILPDADYAQGWTALWPKLFKIKPKCMTEKELETSSEEAPIPPLKLYRK